MREHNCFLSVVVPVYNTEKYLKRCLDSALAASIDNMQIILVDDGSTDGSPAICDQYAAAHTNVSVIHQNNSGVSVTRNVGIETAQGEYVFFLDSDDCVHPEIFRKVETFISAKENRPDTVICDAEYVHVETGEQIPMILNCEESEIDNISGEQALLKILQVEPGFEWYCWRFFYRTDYLRDGGHRFVVGVYYEDLKWTPQVLAQAGTVCYMKELGVHYTWCRPNSIVNSMTIQKATHKLRMCEDNFLFFQEKVTDPAVGQLMLASCAETYISIFRCYCRGLKEAYPLLKKYFFLLHNPQTRLCKIFHLMVRLLGFRLGSGATKIVFRLLDKRS